MEYVVVKIRLGGKQGSLRIKNLPVVGHKVCQTETATFDQLHLLIPAHGKLSAGRRSRGRGGQEGRKQSLSAQEREND